MLSNVQKTHSSPSPHSDGYSNTVRFSQIENFCDWLTLHDEHEQAPIINGGLIINTPQTNNIQVSEQGFTIPKIDYMTQKYFMHKGSFETSIAIRSDGHRVTLSGNIGRLGRRDNVWGYTFPQCFELANKLCDKVGMPRFTPKATLSRIDLTTNYQTGSPQGCREAMAAIDAHTMPYLRKSRSGNTTIKYGTMKGRRSLVVYEKAAELLRNSNGNDEYIKKLASYLHEVGTLRFESRVGRKFIAENAVKDDIISSFLKCLKPASDLALDLILIIRNSDKSLIINELDFPKPILKTLHLWKSSKNLMDSQLLSKSTLYRHAKIIRNISNIDIFSSPIHYQHLAKKIEINVLSPPQWYDFS